MSLTFRQLNPHACRSYLVRLENEPECVVIDPVLDHVQDYVDRLHKDGLELVLAVDTHTHADHISGCAALRDLTGCDYLMHIKSAARCANHRVRDGDTFHLFGEPVKIMHTPGHTQDGICLVFPDRVFTGDTLFLDDGGAGRDDLPGGDPGAHYDSLERLRALPDHLVVYPAHEYRNREPSTLGEQKKRNPHLTERTREEFVQYLEDLRLGPAEWMKDVLKANYVCARDPDAAWIPVDAPACEVKGTLDIGVNEQEVSDISPKEVFRRVRAGEAPLLLDVREKDELGGPLGSLPDLVHIPITQLAQHLSILEAHKNRDIVTVCRTGARAHTAAQIMAQAGFSRVSVLNGGMVAWHNEDLPLEWD